MPIIGAFAICAETSTIMVHSPKQMLNWSTIWPQLGVATPPDNVYSELVAHYSEPHRAYHTLQHLQECFDQLDSVRDLCTHPAEVELALWFHDAIYDTHASDNEERSADWAVEVLNSVGASQDAIARVRALVLATKHNTEPQTQDARTITDIDLAILGAPTTRFDEYEAQVRQEYTWVSDAEFRQARGRILREFLARDSIYATPVLHEQFEVRARTNLTRSLQQLVGHGISKVA